MVYIPFIIAAIAIIVFKFIFNYDWLKVIIGIIISAILTVAIVAIDKKIQSTDTEVWSGTVIGWDHDEEYDERVEDRDKDGKVTGYHYVHHDATNSIKTSDGGWINVYKSPDGKRFDDWSPNNASELKTYWPEGTPSTSSHTYENKVQASYSIYRHEEIDLKKYKDLPKYPMEVHDYIYIDKILGNVPNKQEALIKLNELNTYMNKSVPNPEKPGKTTSWKQVNLIFVNVGADKSEDYGFALQDKWEGGNKNDFVVSFSMDDTGKVNWVYPFSWADSQNSELLKIKVRDYMLDQKTIKDFVPVITQVSDLVIQYFERKQFANFSYIEIQTSTPAVIIIWILNILMAGVFIIYCASNKDIYNNW